LLAFAVQPLVNGYSRRVETESDAYGLEITGDNDAAARAFLALARENRSDPEPRRWVKFLLYSHPPTR
jgi:Zn-dependent protease with chaperone function